MEFSDFALIISLPIILLCSIFCSLCETSFVSISKARAKYIFENNPKSAKKFYWLVQEKEALISTVLIIVNISAVVFSSISTIIFVDAFYDGNEAIAIVFSAFFSTIVLVLFGDIFPKVAASRNPEKIALKLANPMFYAVKLLSPISSFLNFIANKFLAIFGSKNNNADEIITEDEILAMINIGTDAGILKEYESEIIDKTLDLKENLAEDIMIPRLDIICANILDDYSKIFDIFKNEHISRLPIYDEDIDHIIGILNFKDFAFLDKNDFDLKKIIREPLVVSDLKPINSIFADMKKENTSIAIVIDEYGGTQGLITMENLIESIMGEIFDEYDDAEDRPIIKINDNEYKAQGSARIDDFNRISGIYLESSDYKSLGGYISELFGYIPNSGDSIFDKDRNLLFTIIDSEKNRIELIKIQVIENESNNDKED